MAINHLSSPFIQEKENLAHLTYLISLLEIANKIKMLLYLI